MGGKALNRFGVFTERKNTEEFLRIGNELKSKVEFTLPVTCAIVTCYRTKESHGDLDLLISIGKDIQLDWKNYIENTFQPKAINANGGVYSFDYQGFQVDFIPIPERKWATALVYFSYDPLGNIMGKTFHKFGMSYGWEGLYYKYRNAHGTNSSDILLTNDVKRIFEFGGYDYDRYLKGFDTLEEIFQFAINSKYFDTEMFQMENLKSLDKKRNRKRGSYHLFLNYLKDNGINSKYPFEEAKELYLPKIDVSFPEAKLMDEISKLQAIDARNSELRMRFNGDIVMMWLPDLQGKELGNAMGKFKTALGDNYEEFILHCSFTELHDYFMKVYNGEN
jgi:hypothetical protein